MIRHITELECEWQQQMDTSKFQLSYLTHCYHLLMGALADDQYLEIAHFAQKLKSCENEIVRVRRRINELTTQSRNIKFARQVYEGKWDGYDVNPLPTEDGEFHDEYD